MCHVAVIGTGVVGSAVALLLRQKGYTVTGVCSKTGVSAAGLAAELGCKSTTVPGDIITEADIVFLTTPDRELSSVASRLADSGTVNNKHIFYHMSGALPAEVLSPLKEKGAAIGAAHPLQSFATIEKAIANLPGSFFAIQGDNRAVDAVFKIVADLGGKPFLMKSEDKALYHLGACIASNYLVAVIHFAVSIFSCIGMSPEQAAEALLPLIKGTLANIEVLGPVKSLTGPVARGDAGTIERHLEAIKVLDPSLAELYKTLGRYTTQVAIEKGSIDKVGAEKLFSIFREEGEADV